MFRYYQKITCQLPEFFEILLYISPNEVSEIQANQLVRYRTKINSNVGYCRCGAEVWIEFLTSGNKWIFRYFDNNHNEITKCPDCGIELKEDDLESR